jgi:predicted TIM-barrel fold metal-dependent hydrolase
MDHDHRAIAVDDQGDERYVVISADCHGGGNVLDYRPYLEREWLDEFDAWVAEYEVPHDDLKGDKGDRNWNSARRMRDLEDDGIVAEVVFPNTVPPFFPKTALTAQPPAVTSADSERRWAGLRAHNRWLADFCAETSGRRAGVAQINLHDIDSSVEEVRRIADAGITGGILLPGTPPGLDLPQLFDPTYEPLWEVCEELGVPVNHHTGSAAPPMGPSEVDAVIFLLEVSWWAHRALTHLITAGVLDRHPDLQLVLTEQGTAWIPDELMKLDYFFERMSGATGSQEAEWGRDVVGRLSLRPSEYWARQCHVGASFIRPGEVELRHAVGVDRIMWGSDYPHKESSHPYSLEAMRLSFAGVPRDEVAMMLGGNAAELYGFDLDALRPIAARVGPRVVDVDTPIVPGELPIEADKCPAFAGQTFATASA